MEKQEIHEVVKVLLQDTFLLEHWNQISNALELPFGGVFPMQMRFAQGWVNCYDALFDVLQRWVQQKGGVATVKNFVEILKKEGFNQSASAVANKMVTVGKQTHPDSTITGSEGMKPRNLVVKERLDYGSFSEVFKVHCTLTDKSLAVKRISIGRFVERTRSASSGGTAIDYFRILLREVRVMARLQPQAQNIVIYQDTWFEGPLSERLYSMLQDMDAAPPPTAGQRAHHSQPIVATPDEKDTYMCIKMELMDTNLWHYFQYNTSKIGNIPLAKSVTNQILEGLAFMHKQKIVHRDLKPNNILLNVENEMPIAIKIGDFGLSREVTDSDTQLSIKVGTKEFSSPEMYRGAGYSFKTDIFSLGLVCLTMLYRFTSTTEMERAFDNIRSGSLHLLDTVESSHGKTYPLLRDMLAQSAESRPTAAEALQLIMR